MSLENFKSPLDIAIWLHGLDWTTKDTVDQEWWKTMYHPAIDKIIEALRKSEGGDAF